MTGSRFLRRSIESGGAVAAANQYQDGKATDSVLHTATRAFDCDGREELGQHELCRREMVGRGQARVLGGSVPTQPAGAAPADADGQRCVLVSCRCSDPSSFITQISIRPERLL